MLQDSLLGSTLINIFINPRRLGGELSNICYIHLKVDIKNARERRNNVKIFNVDQRWDNVVNMTKGLTVPAFDCDWLKRMGKMMGYSVEKDIRKYNAIYMKVISKWQCELADSKINWCKDGTIRPYL